MRCCCRARRASAGCCVPTMCSGLLDQHCSGSHNHHTRLWALLMLELWFRMWIDGSPESAMLRPAA